MNKEKELQLKIQEIYQKYDFLCINQNDLNKIFDQVLSNTISTLKKDPKQKIEDILLKLLEEHFEYIILKRIKKNKSGFFQSYIQRIFPSNLTIEQTYEELISLFALLSKLETSLPDNIYSTLLENQSIQALLSSNKIKTKDPKMLKLIEEYQLIEIIENKRNYEKSNHHFSKEETLLLIKKSQNGDLKARNLLIEANLDLIYFVIHKYYPKTYPGLEREDLVQLGVLGLIKTIQNFDTHTNYSFTTYAVIWIVQVIRREISHNMTIVSSSYNERERAYQVQKIIQDYKAKKGRTPTLDEISQITKLNPKKIKNFIQLNDLVLSLDEPISIQGKSSTLNNVLAHPGERMENKLETRQMQVDVRNVLNQSSLTEVEKEVLIMRYDLDGKGYRTCDEIGKMLSFSRQGISQIEMRALKKLKQMKEIRDLYFYISDNHYVKKKEKEDTVIQFDSIFYQQFSVSKERVDEVIAKTLSQEEKMLIQKKYNRKTGLSKNEKDTLYGKVLPKIKKYIKNNA